MLSCRGQRRLAGATLKGAVTPPEVGQDDATAVQCIARVVHGVTCGNTGGMSQTTRTLTYRGPAAFVSMLAQMLEEEGARVEWERPLEKRGSSEIVEAVVAQLIATGTVAGIAAALKAFRERARGRADVTEDDDDTPH